VEKRKRVQACDLILPERRNRLQGDQLDPIPEWVRNMAPPNAGDAVVILNLDARRSQLRS